MGFEFTGFNHWPDDSLSACSGCNTQCDASASHNTGLLMHESIVLCSLLSLVKFNIFSAIAALVVSIQFLFPPNFPCTKINKRSSAITYLIIHAHLCYITLTFDMSHKICMMSSANFLEDVPFKYHHEWFPVSSTSCSFNEFTTLLPFVPFTLTWSINDFAIMLKKLSRSPILWPSDWGLAMENPVGGSRAPVNEANALGDTSGNTRLSKSVT